MRAGLRAYIAVETGVTAQFGYASYPTPLAWGASFDPDLVAEAKRINVDVLATSGEELQKLIDKMYATPADIVEKAKATYGRVDVIFLNAGIMPSAPLSRARVAMENWP